MNTLKGCDKMNRILHQILVTKESELWKDGSTAHSSRLNKLTFLESFVVAELIDCSNQECSNNNFFWYQNKHLLFSLFSCELANVLISVMLYRKSKWADPASPSCRVFGIRCLVFEIASKSTSYIYLFTHLTLVCGSCGYHIFCKSELWHKMAFFSLFKHLLSKTSNWLHLWNHSRTRYNKKGDFPAIE